MDQLEILYIDEDEILVNPHRSETVRERFPHSDARAKAAARMFRRIDSSSTIVSVSVQVNCSYLNRSIVTYDSMVARYGPPGSHFQ